MRPIPKKASRSRNLPIQSGDAYEKLKIQRRTPQPRATKQPQHVSQRKETIIHTTQRAQKSQRAIKYLNCHTVYCIIYEFIFTCINYTRPSITPPWAVTANERGFRSTNHKNKSRPKSPHQDAPGKVSHGHWKALSRRDGSYIFDAESCNIRPPRYSRQVDEKWGRL